MKNFLIYSALDSIRFDAIRRTILSKNAACTLYINKFALSAQFSILLFAVIIVAGAQFGDIYLYKIRVCVHCIVLYLLVNFSSIDQYLNGYLISFHIVVHSSDHSLLIIDVCLSHSICLGTVAHWQLHKNLVAIISPTHPCCHNSYSCNQNFSPSRFQIENG